MCYGRLQENSVNFGNFLGFASGKQLTLLSGFPGNAQEH
jgi:hypothetical protein